MSILFQHRNGIMLGCILAAASPHAQADRLADIARKNEIVIANRAHSTPLSYLVDDKPVGYAMDICMQVVADIKKAIHKPQLRVRFVTVTASNRIPAMTDGLADLECGSTTNTAERRKWVDFSIPYFISSSRFLVKTSSGIQGIDQLKQKTVVSTQGSNPAKLIQDMNQQHQLGIVLTNATDHQQSFDLVVQGKADAFVMDDILLYALKAQAPNPADYQVVGKPISIEPYAIMLPKGEVRLKRIADQTLIKLIQSRRIDRLYAKWFEQPIAPKGVNLNFKMPFLLKDSFRFPSDKVDAIESETH